MNSDLEAVDHLAHGGKKQIVPNDANSLTVYIYHNYLQALVLHMDMPLYTH